MQRDLVERAQRGDRGAFGLLAEASIGRLYNVAQLMVADPDLADDAVQEALIVAWRDLRALRDADRFDPWLHRILVRCVYRVAGGERRASGLGPSGGGGDGHARDHAGDVANRDEVDRGFRRLKAEYRAVLVVHHYLGLSDDEAAEVLGIPAGTVKSRLHRATAAMRAALDADTRAGVPRAVENVP
jgi:RNA polymerase sigma-70 factor (ECF subfamily)